MSQIVIVVTILSIRVLCWMLSSLLTHETAHLEASVHIWILLIATSFLLGQQNSNNDEPQTPLKRNVKILKSYRWYMTMREGKRKLQFSWNIQTYVYCQHLYSHWFCTLKDGWIPNRLLGQYPKNLWESMKIWEIYPGYSVQRMTTTCM